MIGVRSDPAVNDSGFDSMLPGQYGHTPWGWYAETPNGHGANLSAHQVTEHEDGTITVSPSILVSNGSGPLWHGFLERGVWRET